MLCERDGELGHLRRLLFDVESSGGRVVLIRGEAGIGKSALISQFLGDVGDRAHVLLGECDDLLTPQPLGPIWDLAHDEPSVAGPLAEGDRRGVMEALLALLSRRLRPTVVAFEDVQWADEATLDVTRFLGRRITRTRGLVLLTYRDGEVDTFHPLRMVIGALPPQNIVRMRLSPLSRDAVAAMVEDRGLDVEEMMRLSGGNPLLVTEMIATGVEGIPVSIRDLALGRAAKLSRRGRDLLELVAVMPGGAAAGLLGRIVGEWRDGLVEGDRLGFLRLRGDTVTFRHELLRRAIESSLDEDERRRLNRRVLEHLDESTDPAVLAHHAREAGDAEAFAAAGPRAARAATAAGSRREALQQLRALEPYLDRLPVDERAGLWEDRARVERYVDFGAAADAISRAIELYRGAGLDRDLARALASAVRLFEMSGRPDDAQAAAADSVEILRRHPPDAGLAYALSQQAWLATFREEDDRKVVEFADDAIGIAETTGDEPTVIDTLNTKGVALADRGDPEALALLEEGRSRAERHGHAAEEIRALNLMASLTADLLDLDLVEDLAQRSLAIAIRHEIPADEAWAKVFLAWVDLYRGRWDAAYDAFSEALGSIDDAANADRHVWSVPHELNVTAALATLQARMGRPEARATLDRAWDLARMTPWPQSVRRAGLATAEYLWLTGDHDPDAVALRENLGSVPHDRGVRRGSLEFWLWELGVLAIIPDGIAEPYRVLMDGRPAEAAALWEAAGHPYEQALSLMHGDQSERLDALRLLEDLGAAAAAARLRRALRADGVRIPRGPAQTTVRHPAGLTARQAEVLDLLAEGLGNPQIADRLFISSRTVDNHVAAIFTKLGVTDRQAAVEAARDLGLPPSSV